jgi:putative two-component system response regulator
MESATGGLSQAGAGRKTLLVVDDDAGNLDLLGQLLGARYTVLAAPSGRRALRIAAGTPRPDLILLDVLMPEMDGYAVLATLRENPAIRDIPVIFVTGLDAAEDEEKGLNLGAVDYITKPYRPAIVLARVHTHLELKQARDWLRDQNTFLEAEVQHRVRDILLTKSAPLHDIGKVGIPDRILRKPGKLTAEEWEIMRTHTSLGADAIEHALGKTERRIDFLDTAQQIARWHHEKWDGSGYPDGLAGDAYRETALQ